MARRRRRGADLRARMSSDEERRWRNLVANSLVECRLLFLRQHPPCAGSEVPQAYRPIRDTREPLHSKTESLAPPPDDPVAPLREAHIQNAPPLPSGPHPHLGGDDRTAVDQHAPLDRLRDLLQRAPVDQRG